MYKKTSMDGVGSNSDDAKLRKQIKAEKRAAMEGLFTKYIQAFFRLGMSTKEDRCFNGTYLVRN